MRGSVCDFEGHGCVTPLHRSCFLSTASTKVWESDSWTDQSRRGVFSNTEMSMSGGSGAFDARGGGNGGRWSVGRSGGGSLKPRRQGWAPPVPEAGGTGAEAAGPAIARIPPVSDAA